MAGATVPPLPDPDPRLQAATLARLALTPTLSRKREREEEWELSAWAPRRAWAGARGCAPSRPSCAFISAMAASNGAEVVMSTPASLSRSMAYFELPDDSIFRYASRRAVFPHCRSCPLRAPRAPATSRRPCWSRTGRRRSRNRSAARRPTRRPAGRRPGRPSSRARSSRARCSRYSFDRFSPVSGSPRSACSWKRSSNSANWVCRNSVVRKSVEQRAQQEQPRGVVLRALEHVVDQQVLVEGRRHLGDEDRVVGGRVGLRARATGTCASSAPPRAPAWSDLRSAR